MYNFTYTIYTIKLKYYLYNYYITFAFGFRLLSFHDDDEGFLEVKGQPIIENVQVFTIEGSFLSANFHEPSSSASVIAVEK